MKAHRELWERAFGDPDEYMDFYFSQKAVRSGVYSDYHRGELCAMAYFTPYRAVYHGRECKAHYIVGVATEAEYRRQKRMTRLVEQGIEVCRQEGSPVVFLSPEKPRVYQSMGFVGTYWRQTTTVDIGGREWFRAVPFDGLQKNDKKELSSFAEDMLSAEKFELYLEHSPAYYREVAGEMNSLGGDVLVLYRGQEIVAALCYIHEKEEYEVTELICRRELGREAVETVCHYLRTRRLVIEDSYFIPELDGEGVFREEQEKPYIMYRSVFSRESPVLKCYINDLT